MADDDAYSDANYLGDAIANAIGYAIADAHDDACAERGCYIDNPHPHPDCICDAICDIRAVAYLHPRSIPHG